MAFFSKINTLFGFNKHQTDYFKNGKYQNHSVCLKIDNLKFTPDEHQIIYIESTYDQRVNDFICKHYDVISDLFERRGYEFCYVPYLVNKLTRKEYIDYYAPYGGDINSPQLSSDFLFKLHSINTGPSLLYYSPYFKSENWTDKPLLKSLAIDLNQEISPNFGELLSLIEHDINLSKPRYSLCDNHEMENLIRAKYPDSETWELIMEIESKVKILAQKGISEHILQQIITKPYVISRMIITNDNRIILPNYNNIEIIMTPLVKAVYFLFLRHPEGIIFKHLVEYREELIKIYENIKNYKADEKMLKSIDDIINPLSNSINEKCARIREAFISRFDEHLATNYIIHGERSMPKRIPLHREFVEWQI